MRDQVVQQVQDLQNRICNALESFESKTRFQKVEWSRPGGGGGDTRVLSGGEVFEKAGVNTSIVHGELPDRMLEKLGTKTKDFFATGISLVIHPFSPQVPTVHANYRFFHQSDRWWFGGGADLTPYVPAPDLFTHFHEVQRRHCKDHPTYQAFKKNCDEYFFVAHRGECRGIGGIFFDHLTGDFETRFEEWKQMSESFLPAYTPIVERTKARSFTERQKKFQLLRRGRYVEFNLVYDRGTLFGLETKGNIESILMSLPAIAHWDFDPAMETNEDERQLMSWLKKPVDWVKS